MESPSSSSRYGYVSHLELASSREDVYTEIATPEGLRRWWSTNATGNGERDGVLTLSFAGCQIPLTMYVEESVRPEFIEWTCTLHTAMPEWNGTHIVFALTETGPDSCRLDFTHYGLTASLRCYTNSQTEWNRCLANLKRTVEMKGIIHANAPPLDMENG